jgi:hypothetical protein
MIAGSSDLLGALPMLPQLSYSLMYLLTIDPVYYVPGSTSKPAARDYNSTGIAILLRATAHYGARIVGLDPFPDCPKQIIWAKKSFSDACKVAGKDFAIDDRVSSIVSCNL